MQRSDTPTSIFLLLVGLLLTLFLPVRLAGIWLISLPFLSLITLHAPYRWIGFVLTGALIGLLWQSWALSLRPAFEGAEPIQVTGVVVGLPTSEGGRQRFLLKPLQWHGVRGSLPRRIRVSVYDDGPRVQPGERWKMWLRLKRPRGFMNPVRFDYEHWLASEHIDATGYRVQSNRAQRLTSAGGLDYWRSRVSSRIATLTPAVGQGTALLQGLVTGDRRGFSDATWQVLQLTGTSHLMAISGLHIGLVAGLGYALGSWLWRVLGLPGQRRNWVVFIAGLAALGYTALSGFALPAQRALIMLSVIALARLLGQRARGLRVLFMAAFVVLFVDPAAALGAGFWLSFVAVALILLVVRGQRSGFLSGLWRIQVVLVIGLAPLSGIFFGQWSPLGLLINLVVLPLFSLLLVPGALIAAALALPAPALARPLLNALGWGLDYLLMLGNALTQAGWEALPINTTAPVTLALAGLGIGLLLLPAGTPLRLSSLVLMVPLLFGTQPRLDHGSARITWLEVGQGTAAVIETRNQVLVFDTGPSWRSGGNAATFTLLPFLTERGITQIDRLIVSHADNDHRGGVNALIQAQTVHEVVAGESLPEVPNAKRCSQGQRWRVDGVAFAFLWPPASEQKTGNAASCVLLVKANGKRALLTGDIEHEAESRLAATLSEPVDILEAPHHGSATSTTAALLSAAMPDHAVISAGYRNPYRMPHREVLKRLYCAGIKVHDIGLGGALTVTLGANDPIEVKSERLSRGRLLNAPSALGRFRDGEEIHYDQRIDRSEAMGASQRTCGK